MFDVERLLNSFLKTHVARCLGYFLHAIAVTVFATCQVLWGLWEHAVSVIGCERIVQPLGDSSGRIRLGD